MIDLNFRRVVLPSFQFLAIGWLMSVLMLLVFGGCSNATASHEKSSRVEADAAVVMETDEGTGGLTIAQAQRVDVPVSDLAADGNSDLNPSALIATKVSVSEQESTDTLQLTPKQSAAPVELTSSEDNVDETSGDIEPPPALPARPEKPTVVIQPRQSSDGQVLELTFDDLAFEMEKGDAFARSMLSPEISQYDGAQIKLRGYIKPAYSQTGLTKFVFVRDNQECCFGPTAALYDNVLVKLADGVKTEFTVRPVSIEGKFYLQEYKGPDGNVWSIYRMKDSRVK